MGAHAAARRGGPPARGTLVLTRSRLDLDRLTARVAFGSGALLLATAAFSNALAEISGAIFTLAIVARILLTPPGWTVRIFGVLLGVWLAVCLLSVAVGSDVPLGLRTFIGKTFSYGLLAFGMALVSRDPQIGRRLVVVFAWAALGIAVDTAAQWVLGHDPLRWRPINHRRLTGPFVSTNDLASYLVMAVPVQLWLLRSSGGRIVRCVLLAGVLLGLLELWQTDSRSAWYGVFGGFLMLWVTTRSRLPGLLALGFIGVLLLWHQSGSIWHMWHLDPGRAEGWRVAWQMFLDAPWLGKGLGTFMSHYLSYVPVLVGDWSRPQYAHNCFLQILAEVGLLGFGAFVALLGWLLAAAVRQCRRAGPTHAAMLAGLLAAVTGLLINMAFDTAFYALSLATIFWALLGLTAGTLGAVRGR